MGQCSTCIQLPELKRGAEPGSRRWQASNNTKHLLRQKTPYKQNLSTGIFCDIPWFGGAQMYKDQLRSHLEDMRKERELYEARCEKARHHPRHYFSACFDFACTCAVHTKVETSCMLLLFFLSHIVHLTVHNSTIVLATEVPGTEEMAANAQGKVPLWRDPQPFVASRRGKGSQQLLLHHTYVHMHCITTSYLVLLSLQSGSDVVPEPEHGGNNVPPPRLNRAAHHRTSSR